MKIYLSSFTRETLTGYKKRFPDAKPNVLISFAIRNRDAALFCKRHRSDIGDLILDSGAWTKNNALVDTTEITLRSYLAYLRVAAKYYSFYFNFDEDFNDNGFNTNYSNQLILEEAGFQPVPVVHDIHGDEIQVYIDKGYKRVALGSRQITSRSILDGAMRKFEGTGIKIHLFGNASFQLLVNAPIHSCDTAMWALHGKFGRVLYWNPRKEGENKTDKIYLDELTRTATDTNGISFCTYEFRQEFEEYLNSALNLQYYDLIGPNSAENKMLVNTHYLVQLERIITGIHREKGFATEE